MDMYQIVSSDCYTSVICPIGNLGEILSTGITYLVTKEYRRRISLEKWGGEGDKKNSPYSPLFYPISSKLILLIAGRKLLDGL